MKGYRFYLEYPSKKDKRKGTVKNPGNHSGTVLAVIYVNGLFQSSGEVCYDAVGGIQDIPDSPVGTSSASLGYLKERCRRIPESLARQIHPTLFATLDRWEKSNV